MRSGLVSGAPILPAVQSRDQYRALRRDGPIWLPALRTICERHHVRRDGIERVFAGSHIVAKVTGELLIKLYAPPFKADAERERVALDLVVRHTTLHVPRIVDAGELEGWPYVILTAVPGVPLEVAWPSLGGSHRRAIAEVVGRTMRELHAVSGLESRTVLSVDWTAFVRQRAHDSATDHAQAGATGQWVEEIGRFVHALPDPGTLNRPLRFLHADLSAEHLFVDVRGTTPRLAGVIDFGDAMIGDPYYDFVAPAFVFRDAPDLRRAWLGAYGFAREALTPDLSRQLMAYTILHRYGRLPDYLAEFGDTTPADLAELERRLWSFD